MLRLLLVIALAKIQVRPTNGKPASQIPKKNSAPTLSSKVTEPTGCTFNGKWYPPGSEISKKLDGSGGCYGMYCDADGHLVTRDDWNCGRTAYPTTEPPPKPTTSPSHGCFVNGKWYPPWSDVTQGSDGNGWCYGTYCADSSLIAWDDWNCGTTTTTTATPEPENPGCFYNGEWYPPGSEISNGTDGKGWCYGSSCTAESKVVKWDNWNCDSPEQTTQTTIAPTTILVSEQTPTPIPTSTPALVATKVPIPLGCLQDGAWYEPGSEISRESNGEGWCHGIFCDSNGKIVAWDDWNCERAENSNPEQSLPSPQKGCYYENQWHPFGSIFEGSDKGGCKYGAICEMDGKVIRWDEIDCKQTD